MSATEAATQIEPLVGRMRIGNLLALQHSNGDRFRGLCHEGAPGRAYGGQLVAQGLMAAGSTVDEGRPVHSLHSYFFRGGRAEQSIDFTVDRIRDSARHSHRRVIATQDEGEIFTLLASFRRPEASLVRHRVMPSVPGPEQLPDVLPLRKPHPEQAWPTYDLVRFREAIPRQLSADGSVLSCHWLSLRGEIADRQLDHSAAVAYLSDLTLAQTSLYDYTALHAAGEIGLSSLDHSVWFHRPFRLDDWLLYAKRSTSVTQNRGLTTGEFWNRQGELVATATQESLIHKIRGV